MNSFKRLHFCWRNRKDYLDLSIENAHARDYTHMLPITENKDAQHKNSRVTMKITDAESYRVFQRFCHYYYCELSTVTNALHAGTHWIRGRPHFSHLRRWELGLAGLRNILQSMQVEPTSQPHPVNRDTKRTLYLPLPARLTSSKPSNLHNSTLLNHCFRLQENEHNKRL